jgi:hypothetical protein
MKMTQYLIEVQIEHGEVEFVSKALLMLYQQQEVDERRVQITTHNNGVGFNKGDSPFLSYCSLKFINKQTLSADEERDCRRMMKKYAKQLSQLMSEI